MPSGPEPNPETVAALLDTTWRMVAAEDSRTESLDRKAATLATFSSLVLSLVATLGVAQPADDLAWAFPVFVGALVALALAIVASVRVLLPKEHITLGMAYLERFPKWSEILKAPEQVRGETMAGLIEAIALERVINRQKAHGVRRGFLLLLAGLALVAAHASILGAEDAFR